MSSFKSSLLSVFVLLAGFLCLLHTSQAICTAEFQLSGTGNPEEICTFSLDCAEVTSASMGTTYGLEGVTVVPISVTRVSIMNGETFMVKAVLGPHLQGCYNLSKGTLTLYGTTSV